MMGKAVFHQRLSAQERAIEEFYLKAQEENKAELKHMAPVIWLKAFWESSDE